MSQISLAYWSMVRSLLNLPLNAVEMMEDLVHAVWSPYASSTLACASMQGLTLVSFSAQLEHLRVYKRDELSGYGYTTVLS